MNNFSIIYKVNDASAQAAAKRQLKNILDIEKGWLGVAKAQEAAYAKAGGHVNGFTKAAVEGSAKRAKAAADETQKVDIGYYKMAVEGIKYQDRLTKAADKATKERQSFAEKEASKASESFRKSANDRLKRAEDEVKFRQAQFDKAATKEHDRALKEAQDQQRLAEKMVGERKRAADSLEQQKVKALASNAKVEEKNLGERKKAAASLEQQKVKALEAGSKLEDKYLQKEYNDRVKYAKAREKLEEGPLARQARQNRRELSDLEVNQAAKNRVIDRGNKDRINSAMKAYGVEKDMFSQGIADAFGFSSALTKAGIAAGLMTAAFKGLEAISAFYHKIATDAREAANATLDMRKALRVEGVLKGESTATDKTLKEALEFRAATGLGASEASDLTRQYLGSIPIGLQKKNITPEVAKDLMTQVGIMQARQGGDAGTRGELAGLLGQFSKIGSVEEGLGQMEAIRIALTEGRGDDTPLTKQLLKASGAMVKEGAIPSLPEMAAMIGVTSLTAGPEEAATRAEQVNRALTFGITKHSKAKGAKSSQADYLKSIGVTEDMTLEQSLDKLMPDLKKAEGEGRKVETYLAEHGFRSSEEVRAIAELLPNYDVFKERMANARKEQDGAKAMRENKEFLNSAAGKKGVSEALGDVRKAREGLAGETFSGLYGAAEASPEIEKGDKSLMTSTIGDWLRGISTGTYWGATAAGKKERVEEKVLRDLRERAKKSGVSPDEMRKAQVESLSAPDFAAEYTTRVTGLIKAHDGDTAIDTKESMESLTKALDKLRTVMEGKGPAPVGGEAPAPGAIPPALPGPPAAGPAR